MRCPKRQLVSASCLPGRSVRLSAACHGCLPDRPSEGWGGISETEVWDPVLVAPKPSAGLPTPVGPPARRHQERYRGAGPDWQTAGWPSCRHPRRRLAQCLSSSVTEQRRGLPPLRLPPVKRILHASQPQVPKGTLTSRGYIWFCHENWGASGLGGAGCHAPSNVRTLHGE